MANRRFEVHQIRNIIARMRLGESDRQLANAGIVGRRKAAQLRLIAHKHGWLDPAVPLPDNEALSRTVHKPPSAHRAQSLVIPYAEQVLVWAEEGIQWTTIHQAMVRRFGFSGSYDSVKRFLRHHQKKDKATIVLDFEPGDAAQVDFGTGPLITDRMTGEVHKTWFFVMTLASSRHQYAEIVRDQKVETWLGCHRRAFEFFGGVPARVIIDNPKCAITKACFHDPVVQRSYAEIAEAYGFLISPCPPRDPKKKGIVESGVKYLKNGFLPLRDFRDLADANRQLQAWVMETAGNRIHGTTRERPLTRFAETEHHFLNGLPAIAPELASWVKLKLHGNCHIQFEKCLYSAPFTLVHQQLWLRATEKTVQLYHEQKLVAVHARLRKPGVRSTVRDHLPPEAVAYLMQDPQWCLAQAEKMGSHCKELLESLFEDRVLDNLRAAQGVIRLGRRYGAKRLEAACSRALEHDAPTYRAVKHILEKGLDQSPEAASDALSNVYLGNSRFNRLLNRFQ
jgi:transposase